MTVYAEHFVLEISKNPDLFTQYLVYNKIMIIFSEIEEYSFDITSLHNKMLTEQGKSLTKF